MNTGCVIIQQYCAHHQQAVLIYVPTLLVPKQNDLLNQHGDMD